jgi:hypothetical protein
MTAIPADQAPTIAEDIAVARAELVRIDGKAGTLLGIEGVLIALLAPQVLGDPTAASSIGRPLTALLIVLLMVSSAILAASIYPRLPRLPGSLLDQATMTPAQVTAAYADPAGIQQTRAAQLPGLTRMALSKYRLMRAAMLVLAAAGVVMLVALAVALVG